jgi:hypothetical protein
VCGTELSREQIPVEKLPHTPGEPVKENDVPATCTDDGSYDIAVYCTACGAELSRQTFTVPAGHEAGDAVKENEAAATCTEDGGYDAVVYCTVCGEEISRTAVTLPALGHDWGEWSEDTAPTCTEAGVKIRSCARCGGTDTGEIAALGHDWSAWNVVTAPSVEVPGLERRICFRCTEIETREIPALEAQKDRKIQFTVTNDMHFVAHLTDRDYEIRMKTTPAIMWYSTRELTFDVILHSGWKADGYVVNLNGEELKPNADGSYTIPAGKEFALITVYPVYNTAPSASESGSDVCGYCGKVHPNHIWGRLVAFLHVILLFFRNLFKK